MNRRDFVRSTGIAALGLSQFPLRWTAAADNPKRKVLFFTKSAGFEHSTIKREGDKLAHSERVLTDLGREHGFDVTATKDGSVFDGDLDQYDAFFFYTTGDLTTAGSDKNPPMSAAGKEKLFKAVAAGKGMLGSHCASDTFHRGPGRETQKPEDRDIYIRVLGGEFISHGRQQPGRLVVASPHFPGCSGLGEALEIPMEEWYSLKNFADDMHVILVQDTKEMEGGDYQRPPFPCTWARKQDKGRVFYTSMGHREDVWTNPKFQQVLLGGLAWAVGNVEFDPKPNLAQAAPEASAMPRG